MIHIESKSSRNFALRQHPCTSVPVSVSTYSNYPSKNIVTLLEHPPYSLDLAPADFILFPRLKILLTGEQFADAKVVKLNSTKLQNFHKISSKYDLSICMNVGSSVFFTRSTVLRRKTGLSLFNKLFIFKNSGNILTLV